MRVMMRLLNHEVFTQITDTTVLIIPTTKSMGTAATDLTLLLLSLDYKVFIATSLNTKSLSIVLQVALVRNQYLLLLVTIKYLLLLLLFIII